MSYHDVPHNAHSSTGSLRSSQRERSSSNQFSQKSPITPTGTSSSATPSPIESSHHHHNQGYLHLPPPAREFLINVEMWVPSTGGKSSKLKSKTRSRPTSTIFSPSSSSSRANVSGAITDDELSLTSQTTTSVSGTTKAGSIFSSTSAAAAAAAGGDASTSNGATDAGTWKSAVCKLSGEGGVWPGSPPPNSFGMGGGAGGAAASAAPTGSALLTIYASDDNTLQHVINVHKLTSTDVRPCDKSLFNRTDVLALWGHPAAISLSTAPHSYSSLALSPGGANASSLSSSTGAAAAAALGGAFAPIYLSFSSQEAHNTWLVLLRSYTSPEVYGRLIHPEQGGLYRMWRQVELVVVQSRNVDPNPAAAAAGLAKREGAARDLAAGVVKRGGTARPGSAGASTAGADSRPGTATTAVGTEDRIPLTLTNSHTPSVGTSVTPSSSGTTIPSSSAHHHPNGASGNSPTTPTTMTGTSIKSWSTSSLPASVESEQAAQAAASGHHPYGAGVGTSKEREKARERERKEREKLQREKEKREKEKEKERREREKKEMKRLAAHARHGFFAEIVLDGEVCGRTTVKRAPIPAPTSASKPSTPTPGGGVSAGADLPSPEWFESFLFGDLPSFGNLLVMLWRAPEKKEKEKEDRPRSSKGLNSTAAGTTTTLNGVDSVSGGIGNASSMTIAPTASIGAGSLASSNYGVNGSGPGGSSGITAFGGARGAVFLGCVEIALANFRRGEWVEGWWPVYHHANQMSGGASSSATPGNAAGSFSGLGMGAAAMGLGGMSGVGGVAGALVQIGEMKLKIKVDEEIILPSRAYKNVLDALEQRNYLDVLTDLEQKLRIENSMIAPHIISLAVARNRLLKDIIQLAEREVASLSGSTNTLFRGNTVLTKTMETAMAWYGRGFLDASVGPVIRRMIKENVEIEVDPSRLRYANPPSGKRPSTRDSFRPSTRDSYRPGTAGSMMDSQTDAMLESGTRLLEHWCNELWNQMYIVRMDCPVELRRLFGHIRMMVERKFDTTGGADPSSFGMLPRQAISSFVFLRFIVPAILRPHLFGLCAGMPTGGVGRSLTLLAKCTQTLANLNPDAPPKEEYMLGISQCLKQNTVTMIDYLACVSSLPDQFSSSANTSSFLSGPDKHDRLHVIHSLRERLTGAGNTIPTLYKDAIPLLPYALDVPKHLAILSSSVVRNARSGTGIAYARGATSTATAETDGWTLSRFSNLCFDVEAQALKSVATLAQGAASVAAFNGAARRDRSGSASSTGALQQSSSTVQPSTSLSALSGSRVASATTPTQPNQSPWTTGAIRRPTSSRSITTPTGPSSAGNAISPSPVSKPSHTMALPPPSPKKRKSARPSTAPSATTVARSSDDDLHRAPRMGAAAAAAAPDMSPGGAFRYLPPEQDAVEPVMRSPYPQPSPPFQTIHRAESESYVAFHYPTTSSRYQSSNEALKNSVEPPRERRTSSTSRLRDFMRRPATSSGPSTSSQRPKWGEHSPHSSSGEELGGGSQRRRMVGSAGNSSGEGVYPAGKRAEASGGSGSGSSEPTSKKKRGFFGWLGGKK
ncbi:hypothetical protein M408DRAFT_17412 [Serendipita vermifera MAFF 305830]|uniref:Ras-GAP domain-containing protein n=1 Tax=Serendipita vermifera MAFF 305830 TaxID=933852 RepID=A0A0C3AKQ5_SERVB|nr:hypothetical protein M408DRAFT_17412 [Serendipita vermifera MAFF 305830]